MTTFNQAYEPMNHFNGDDCNDVCDYENEEDVCVYED